MTNWFLVDDIQVKEDVLKKAQDGDGLFLSKIADIYYNVNHYAKAMAWFRLGAASNNAYSQLILGLMYAEGEGVTVDYKIAMRWYLKAHINGEVTATNSIGYFYDRGYGVRKDHKTALKWFLVAANNGDMYAQYNLGEYYEEGKGVEVDMYHALSWYQKSAMQGFDVAKKSIKRLNERDFYLADTRNSEFL
ncbi:HCP-like protein [Backusella circina FSU 941]|nr:HCP-like protein [Backusella circina FSU 941]